MFGEEGGWAGGVRGETAAREAVCMGWTRMREGRRVVALATWI